MLQKGWNQSELARQAGIPRDSISTYVRGLSLPTPSNLAKVAAALGEDAERLLPNYVESAINADQSSLEMKVSTNRPDEAWLRVDRRVTMATAVKVIELLNDDLLLAKDPRQSAAAAKAVDETPGGEGDVFG
jgi:transcriptional regulator with XRE-family HTH domain